MKNKRVEVKSKKSILIYKATVDIDPDNSFTSTLGVKAMPLNNNKSNQSITVELNRVQDSNGKGLFVFGQELFSRGMIVNFSPPITFTLTRTSKNNKELKHQETAINFDILQLKDFQFETKQYKGHRIWGVL